MSDNDVDENDLNEEELDGELDEDLEPDESELDEEWDDDFDSEADLDEDFDDEDDDEDGDDDGDEVDDADDDEDDEDREEALDELEAEELDMLTDDEESETLIVDEAQELRAIRRAEIALEGEGAGERTEGEFVCQSCYLVLKTSQLANRRKMLCRDCAA